MTYNVFSGTLNPTHFPPPLYHRVYDKRRVDAMLKQLDQSSRFDRTIKRQLVTDKRTRGHS